MKSKGKANKAKREVNSLEAEFGCGRVALAPLTHNKNNLISLLQSNQTNASFALFDGWRKKTTKKKRREVNWSCFLSFLCFLFLAEPWGAAPNHNQPKDKKKREKSEDWLMKEQATQFHEWNCGGPLRKPRRDEPTALLVSSFLSGPNPKRKEENAA